MRTSENGNVVVDRGQIRQPGPFVCIRSGGNLLAIGTWDFRDFREWNIAHLAKIYSLLKLRLKTYSINLNAKFIVHEMTNQIKWKKNQSKSKSSFKSRISSLCFVPASNCLLTLFSSSNSASIFLCSEMLLARTCSYGHNSLSSSLIGDCNLFFLAAQHWDST